MSETFRPVDQTRFGRPEGNCFMACVASITGIPLDALPDLFEQEVAGDDRHWFIRALEGVKPHGYVLAYVEGDIDPPPGYHIASGMSPRDLMHSTVWRGRQLVHDPHPSRAGIRSIQDWMLVLPLLSPSPEQTNG